MPQLVVDMTWSNEQCAMPLRSSFRKKIYRCNYCYKISPESAVWSIMGVLLFAENFYACGNVVQERVEDQLNSSKD